MNEAEGWIKPSTGFLEGSQVNLHNLVPALSKLKPDEVRQNATSFFQGLWDRQEEVNWGNQQTYDRIADLLRIRIIPLRTVTELPGSVFTQINQYLASVLYMDLPTTMAGVLRDNVNLWGIPLETVFSRAASQTESEFLSHLDGKVPLPMDEIFAIHRPSSFIIASGVLSLLKLFESEPEKGVLVAVPTRSHLIGLALNSRTSIQHVETLASESSRLSSEHPGAISPHLFWMKDGCLLPMHEAEVWGSFCAEALQDT